MAAVKVIGSSDPVVTSVRSESSNRNAKIVEVEGLLERLEHESPASWCPSGYQVESSSLASTGDGMGKMTICGVSYNEGASFGAEKVTFRVDMQEVSYDLEDHPHLKTDRAIILKWLATEDSKRVNSGKYYFGDNDGNLVEIKNADYPFAYKFITAYMSSITRFNRYFPVVERISIYKNPPGLNMSGRSFTGGSPAFSNNIGKYNDPPISLEGYPSGHWFKSKDSWVQNADTTWTRTEQWTYTPESSSGANGWIYTSL